MTTILHAGPIIEKKVERLTKKVKKLKLENIVPKLGVILVGNDPASLTYINRKKKLCEQVGCDFELITMNINVDQTEFVDTISALNSNPNFHGIIAQLPLPPQLSKVELSTLINPSKDVDGFGVQSIIDLYTGNTATFTPCTPKGIVSLLEHYQIQITGRDVVIIGRSSIVGKPLSLLLTNMGATVTLCHSKTQDLRKHTLNADIIISAVGKDRLLSRQHFREDASQIIVDVGINRASDQIITGDVDFQLVKDQVSAISPVPGGVGPLTVVSLIENLVTAAELSR